MSSNAAVPSASLRKNTTYMVLAQAARLVVQAFYFLLMARGLGPEQYGAFVAVAAAVAMAYPFVGRSAMRNRAGNSTTGC